MSADDSKGGGLFGFIDVLSGLPPVPKIIMCIGFVILVAGLFSSPFSLLHNPKIASGVALMFASLGWWEAGDVIWHEPGPPYKRRFSFLSFFKMLACFAFAAGGFFLTYCLT